MKSNYEEPKKIPPFADLQKLPEDERIKLIGHMVTVHKKTVGIVLEHERDKIQRYVGKLEAAHPGELEFINEQGLTANTVLLKIKPKENT